MTQPPSPYSVPAPQARLRTWPWVLLGLGIAVVLALVGVLVFSVCAGIGSQLAAGTCLPGDFPRYQGTTTTGLHVFQGTGGTSCDMTFQSADSADQVTAFYRLRLDQGDWQVQSADSSTGTIQFERRSRPSTGGRIQVYGRGTRSTFEVQLNS